MSGAAVSKPVAFITYAEAPDLTPSDQLAVAALADRELQARAVIWNDAKTDWAAFSALIMRSCWDYFLHPDEFSAWLEQMERAGIPVWNPIEMLRWNMDKYYLSDLQEAGVRIPPSLWLPKGARVQLAELLSERGWAQAVVKPVISAGAYRTLTVNAAEAADAQTELEGMLAEGAVLVQAFLEEVQSKGEWSLIFLGGEFSHAVLKTPGDGDFRVQEHLGGSVQAAEPPPYLVQQAEDILAQVDVDLLYARVDGVEQDGQLILMELELLEPSLFFEQAPGAAGRFAQLVVKWLENPSTQEAG